MDDRGRGPLAVVVHRDDLVLIVQPDGGQGRGVALQHPLDIHLRDPVRQLRRAPRAAELLRQFGGLARGRQPEAGQFVAGIGRVVDDVGRVVRRQAEPADLVGEAEPPEMLHRARLGGVGLGAERVRPVVIEQGDGHVAPPELDGQHQPGRPAADDDDVRFGKGQGRRHESVCQPAPYVRCQAARSPGCVPSPRPSNRPSTEISSSSSSQCRPLPE